MLSDFGGQNNNLLAHNRGLLKPSKSYALGVNARSKRNVEKWNLLRACAWKARRQIKHASNGKLNEPQQWALGYPKCLL